MSEPSKNAAQTNTPIMDFLVENANKKYVSFHMPGHKGERLYRELGYGEFLGKMADCDITEVIGADNLFQAEGIIKAAQERYARLYGAKKSYLLVNGTSGGIISAIMAAVPAGGKLIMARNSHKSVFNALTMAGIRPAYAYPDLVEEYGITGEISPKEIEKLLEENPEAAAVILPSPNYYGICSDIRAIADIVHRHDKILIVDQAHGAHLHFFDEIKEGANRGIQELDIEKDSDLMAAENLGADIVINSTHKTLASFTGSAVLNLCSDRVPELILEDKLQMIQTSSPSYILMASLDINASIIEEHGDKLFRRWIENVEETYENLSKIEGVKVLKHDRLDRTKINIDMGALGISGSELELALLERGIRAELTTGNILMCMSGIGNTREDFQRLVAAVREIAKTRDGKPIANRQCDGVAGAGDTNDCTSVANTNLLAREVIQAQTSAGQSIANRRCDGWGAVNPYMGLELCTVPARKEVIKLEDAKGRICASSIIPYPPGIPLVCPGERITAEVIEYIKTLRSYSEKIIGLGSDGCIIVGIKDS